MDCKNTRLERGKKNGSWRRETKEEKAEAERYQNEQCNSLSFSLNLQELKQKRKKRKIVLEDNERKRDDQENVKKMRSWNEGLGKECERQERKEHEKKKYKKE